MLFRSDAGIGHGLLVDTKAADFIEELRSTKDADGKNWYDLTSQALAVFLPV